MARIDTGYNPSVEPVQVTASPNIQTVQANFDTKRSGAAQLAAMFGNAQPELEKSYKMAADAEKQAAQEFAATMTVDELRNKVKNGELPAWKSPVFVATLQHTLGENTSKEIYRDAESRVINGEFKNPGELEAFLNNRRNDALAGKSEYEIAGFDKNWNQLKQNVQQKNVAVYAKQVAEKGLQIANEDLANATSEITTETFNGKTNEEKIAYVLGKYNLQRTSGTLVNDDMSKNALDGVIYKLAASGNKELVDSFLKSKLPNNGPSVEAFLTPQRSAQLSDMAQRKWDQNNREANLRVQQATEDAIVTDATKRADELVAISNGGAMPDVSIPQVDGTSKTLKGKDLVAGAVARQIAANPDMPLDQQVLLYKRNGVSNDAWKRELQTAVWNLGELTIDAQGKPSGNLLPATAQAIEKFGTIRQVSEQFAKDLVGDEAFKTLDRIQALREGGVPDLTQAASLVNQINRRATDPNTWGNIQKTINSEIESIRNPGFFTGRFWGELFRGEFGEGDKNIIPIEQNLKRLSETYLHAGIAPDAKTAVKMASDYMSKVVVQTNNTMYMVADLPKVPEGEDTIKWFEKYQKEVILPRLNKMGIDPSLSDLTLIPQKGGQPTYMVANRAQPLPGEGGVGTMIINRSDIENWVKGQIEIRQQTQADQANKDLYDRRVPPRYRKTVDTQGGAAMVSPRGVKPKGE